MTSGLAQRETTSLEESLRRLRTLVSPYTGVVGSLRETLSEPSDDRLVRIGASLAAGGWLAEPEHLVDGGGGVGVDRSSALAAAIGEAAERYSASLVPEEELVLACAAELGPEAVDPGRFALFSRSQYESPGFPFVPFTPTTPVSWIRGTSIPGGEPAWLPAQLVFLSGGVPAGRESTIGYATSNGAACAPTRAEAVLAGLLEVLERDAFMIVWADRLSLPRLDSAGSPGLRRLDATYFACSGVEYAAVDLSVFHDLPTVLAVVRSGRPGAVSVGAAACPTVEEAWRKALAEAFAVRSWGRVLAAERRGSGSAVAADVRSFADHVAFYTDPELATAADFLDGATDRTSVASVSRLEGGGVVGWTDALARRLDACGSSAYAVEIAAPDIADAGLHVVKTIVPELCPLDVEHDLRFHGGTRLYEAAWKLGLRGSPLAEADLNPFPHPFP